MPCVLPYEGPRRLKGRRREWEHSGVLRGELRSEYNILSLLEPPQSRAIQDKPPPSLPHNTYLSRTWKAARYLMTPSNFQLGHSTAGTRPTTCHPTHSPSFPPSPTYPPFKSQVISALMMRRKTRLPLKTIPGDKELSSPGSSTSHKKERKYSR